MANELSVYYPTPSLGTIYFVVGQDPNKLYNTSGTPAFETTNLSHWGSYAVAATDAGGFGDYRATFPAGITAGIVNVFAYLKLGGSPASTDTLVGIGVGQFWDGTRLYESVNAAKLGGQTPTVGDGVAQSFGANVLRLPTGDPRKASNNTGLELVALDPVTGVELATALITSSNTGTFDQSFTGGWVPATPTASTISYIIQQAAASGGGSSPSAISAVVTPAVVAAMATAPVGSVAANVSINLGQTGLSPRALDTVSDGALTVGDALVAAVAGGAGKEVVSGTSYVVKTPFTGTAIRTFTLTLDQSGTPTSRA